mgnify:CR=1 FL=1
MTHDDTEKEALFLRYWPAQMCMHLFFFMVVTGYFKWQYQVHTFHWKKGLRIYMRWTLKTAYRLSKKKLSRKTVRVLAGFGHKRFFIRESTKSMDCSAGSLWVDCRHDETISNKAATIWEDHEFSSPVWVVGTKVITERLEKKHLETSKEICRPVVYEPPPKPTKKSKSPWRREPFEFGKGKKP